MDPNPPSKQLVEEHSKVSLQVISGILLKRAHQVPPQQLTCKVSMTDLPPRACPKTPLEDADDSGTHTSRSQNDGYVNENDEEQKRTKKSFRKLQIPQEFTQRQDVVLKTILRMLRRYFVTKFNEMSGYIKAKRGRDGAFYLEKVRDFVSWLASSKTP